MKMTVVASYRAVPLMLTVAPSGSTNLMMLSWQPICSAHCMLTCTHITIEVEVEVEVEAEVEAEAEARQACHTQAQLYR